MKKRMMVLLLAAAMGMAMAGCQYGGDADAKSEQEETKKEGTKRSMESGRGRISDDSPGASSDGGGLFPALAVWGKTAYWKLCGGGLWFPDCFFLGRYCACGSGRIVSSHVPFCESRI